ncbi:MAG: hypothetical protein ABSE90_01455 [Verrucomicrobiota bacterium]|jgi:hypothetical protein
MKNLTLRRNGGLTRSSSQRFCTVVITALWLATVNLLAAGPAVNWLSGGPLAPDSSASGYGDADGDITTDATYHTPCGIAVDLTGGYVFLADRDNNAVRMLEFDNNQAYHIVAFDEIGNVISNMYSSPVGVAIDSSGNLFVLNYGGGTNGYVLELPNYSSGFITNLTRLTNAGGIALDTSDNVYVTASNQVFKITPAGVSNIVTTITASNASLQGIVMKRSGPSAGKLAVCDSGRNGIYLINPTSGAVATNAGFHGAGDFVSANNYAASNSARFFQPTGVDEAGDGTLIVTDYGNHRVKAVLANGSVTNLYGVASNHWVLSSMGYPGFTDLDNGVVHVPDQDGGVSARQPFGVAFGPGSDGTTPTIYVTEDYYHIIRMVTGAGLQPKLPWPPSAPAEPTATAGYGQVVLTWNSSAGAMNYNIKRSTTNGTEMTIANTASSPYTDTNLLDGVTYYYVVSGLNTGGEGPNSGEVSATPTYSPAPTNLIVVTTNFSLVRLAWSPSTGATSYNVKRSQSTNTFTTIGSTASTSYDDINVVNGTTYYYVVTAVNPGGESTNNSPIASGRAPLPQVPDPQIGYVTFPPPGFSPVFNVGSQAGVTFPNDTPIVIIGAVGSQTFYTYSYTLAVTNLPDPTALDNSALNYPGSGTDPTPYTVAQILPDVSIKAIGEQSGHPNSGVVSALFSFTVGNPFISGDNAAQFTVTNITAGAQMWYTYTTDGSIPPDPTNAAPSLGPVTSGATLSLSFGSGTNLQFKIRGFKANYHPSSIVTKTFLLGNFVPNTISFGFGSGPGSSKFVASAGQTFFVPVGLSLLSSTPPIYGLQFNVTLTNLVSDPVDPQTINFFSLLGKPDPETPGYFLTIPPWMFVSTNQPNNDPNAFTYQGDWYQNLVFADTNSEDLLGVGWLEVYGRTNLYVTTSQNLLTYPLAFGADTISNVNQMIVGSYYFPVPLSAIPGDVYQIQLGRAGGTTFAGISYGSPVTIAALTDTNKIGPGSINGLKDVTIGQIKYLVGSVYPANWYNAGDFGSKDLLNLDVIRVFDLAAYPIATPPPASDLFDALDSCGNIGVLDGATGYLTNTLAYPYPTNYPGAIVDYTDTYDTNRVLVSHVPGHIANFSTLIYMTTYYVTVPYTITNIFLATPPAVPTTNIVQTNYVIIVPPGNSTLFTGNDTTINQIAFGDGVLDVCDVYVTFRRSLDTNSLVWFQRFWTNGVRVAVASNAPAIQASASGSSGGKVLPAFNSSGSVTFSVTNLPSVNFASTDRVVTAGQTIQIPVTASVFGPYHLRVAMLNISVVPLDGSPALTTPISFSPGAALGAPTPGFTDSRGAGNYSAAWLNSAIAGISNSAVIGTLTVTIPTNATSLSAYAVHFDHASASPNGIASFPKHTLTGLITLSSRNTSSFNDGIPDLWRLRWFGTANNELSRSNNCPSGDGVNNWKKYVAGVDPNTANDFPSLNPNTPPPSGAAMSIYWPTVSGKHYAILSSASLFPGNWTTNATITGNGNTMEFDDSSAGAVKFYRVLILP